MRSATVGRNGIAVPQKGERCGDKQYRFSHDMTFSRIERASRIFMAQGFAFGLNERRGFVPRCHRPVVLTHATRVRLPERDR